MRPVRLTLTAFGPYAGTEQVDFDNLSGLGLFVVAGNNGAGKTTIFDALHYGLFGTLPGRRATYIRLKSDHADDRTECRVVLDFVAHGVQWRVERSPKQKRRKRRGSGHTTVDRRATLSRLDHGPDGPATTVANRITEVDEKCRELVGLTGKQFERVALLPQGEFSRLLTESATDRRELLRTLFSSEVFGDATNLLVEQAAAATAADRSAVEQLDARVAALADEVSELTATDCAATEPELARAIERFRSDLDQRRIECDRLETDATTTADAYRTAVETSERRDRLVELERELAEHLAHREQHEADRRRLDAARSAVPVVANARSVEAHAHRLAQARRAQADARLELNHALQSAGIEPLADTGELDHPGAQNLGRRLTERARELDRRRERAQRLGDLEAALARTQAEHRRVENDQRVLAQRHDEATAAERQARAELARLETIDDVPTCERAERDTSSQAARREELERLQQRHAAVARRAGELDDHIVDLERRSETASRAQALLVSQRDAAAAALQTHETAAAHHQAALDLAHTMAELQRRRSELEHHDLESNRLWDDFMAGATSRIAETLVDGDPCPVCGSCEHPEPARTETAEIVDEARVRAARDRADTSRQEVRELELQAERLREAHPTIMQTTVEELAAEVSTTKAMALGAQARADETHTTAATGEQVAVRLRGVRVERTEVDDELRRVQHEISRIEGALGPDAQATLAAVRERAETARVQLERARAGVQQRTDAHDRLAQATTHSQGIDAQRIAAGARLVALDERRAEQQDEVDAARAELAEVDSELGFTDFEMRARAVRHAIEGLSRLTTAAAVAADAADAVRRARSILEERLDQSTFDTIESAQAAALDTTTISQLEAQTASFEGRLRELRGRRTELGPIPDERPDLDALAEAARSAAERHVRADRELVAAHTRLDRLQLALDALRTDREARLTTDTQVRRLERVAGLVRGDNERNTSLENWVLAAHLRDVVELANIRLARSTHQRFQLCVLDDGENRRGKWGLDLGVEDTVTGTRRPTAGLSGGELFQASLALALGLADAVMNQTAGVRIDALFIDEGFGSLDETSVERAIDLLDELRDQGAMVGVITHVPALLDALPLGVRVVEAAGGSGSTIRQAPTAA